MIQMTEATTKPRGKKKAAAPATATKGTTKNRKVKVFGIDDMVNAIWDDIQADETSPKSAREALTKVALKSVLQREQELIVGAVSTGDKVTYVGFGTYEKRERAARKGRNPQTGAEMDIEAKTVPAFKAGKGFKDSVKK
jgi:DNA-binding protein HU-beta